MLKSLPQQQKVPRTHNTRSCKCCLSLFPPSQPSFPSTVHTLPLLPHPPLALQPVQHHVCPHGLPDHLHNTGTALLDLHVVRASGHASALLRDLSAPIDDTGHLFPAALGLSGLFPHTWQALSACPSAHCFSAIPGLPLAAESSICFNTTYTLTSSKSTSFAPVSPSNCRAKHINKVSPNRQSQNLLHYLPLSQTCITGTCVHSTTQARSLDFTSSFLSSPQ